MSDPSIALMAAMEPTWPAARRWRLGPFDLRDGQGGGSRVSAATVTGDFDAAELDAAEAAMEHPLFQVRPGEDALEAALVARGYRVADRVVLCAAPVADLARDVPPMRAFPHWPPLQIARSLWDDGGIGPARQAIMDRAAGAKAVILARLDDRPAGAAFAALSGDTAFLHAVLVHPRARRQGAGRALLACAAAWAAAEGAVTLALAVAADNAPARALYAAAGMAEVGRYHYRAR